MKTAFTLIELLVVVAIISLLTAMSVPIVSTAQEIGYDADSRALLMRIEGGLESFKEETDVFPVADHPAIGAEDGSLWDNGLLDKLATPLTDTAYRNLIDSDLVSATSAAKASISSSDITNSPSGGDSTARRYASVRARMAILAGMMDAVSLLNATPLVGNPQTQGWQGDYLARNLPEENRATDGSGNIVDQLGNPILYVNRIVPGVMLRRGLVTVDGGRESSREELGFDPNDHTTIINYSEGAFGVRFKPVREITTSIDSDIRDSAAAKYIYRYELWAVGMDESFDPLRSHSDNQDNISITHYNTDLEEQ